MFRIPTNIGKHVKKKFPFLSIPEKILGKWQILEKSGILCGNPGNIIWFKKQVVS